MTSHLVRRIAFLAPLLALVVTSCDKDDNSSPPPTPGSGQLAIVKGPMIRANPNPAVPLAALITVETDEPTQVELQISDGTITWTVLAESDYKLLHDTLPVLGMRPGRMHQIAVTARNRAGTTVTAPNLVTFTTPALPPTFPDIDVTVSHPQQMEPGVTLLSVLPGGTPSFPTMVDAAGEVVWYLDTGLIPQTVGEGGAVQRLPNGNVLLYVGQTMLLEIDMLGNIVTGWFADNLRPAPPGTIPVALDSFHHEILPLPPGEPADFLVLSSEVRLYPNYPADEVDLTQVDPQAFVAGDTIVEFRRDGTIVRETKLLDILDPYRLSYDSLGRFWNRNYGATVRDWSHGNGVVIDPNDDSYVISMRHQDAVVKIDRMTGALVWILGDHGRWGPPWSSKLLTPIGGPFEWMYHQHAPEIGANGEILLFDNGNNRAIPPLPRMEFKDSYSRAVEYRVDPVAMTVEQVWAYGGRTTPTQPSFYSFFLCDADRMASTRNVLVCDGGRQTSPSIRNRFGRIAEVTQDPDPKVVFEIYVGDPTLAVPGGFSVYRAVRVPSVYPD